MKVRAIVSLERHHGFRCLVANLKVRRLVSFSVVAIAALVLFSMKMNAAQATTIVSPAGFQNTEGNSSGGGPTGFTRVQYLYPASDFPSVLQHQLVGIAWRPDATTGPVTTSAASFALRLSTTSANELSTTFVANIGADETLVFNGPLTISTPADQTPRKFDFSVDFQTPFHYDPTKGNLLVEFITTGFNVGDWRVDNQNVVSGPITLVQGNPSQSVASGAFSTLAVMQFTFVPEPSMAVLGGLGLMCLFMGRRRRTAFPQG
jgi:hypothetical protein